MALVNEKEEEENAEKALKGEFIEEEPAGLISGIKIKHLAKVSSRTDTQRVNMSPRCKSMQMVQVSRTTCRESLKCSTFTSEISNKVTRPPYFFCLGDASVCFGFIPTTGIQSGQQDTASCAGSHSEHVRGTDHGAAGTQRCRKDHHTVHADR